MSNMKIYESIARRSQGDIYVGVVGPVRTGKSTFIKRFMDLMVLPNVANQYVKARIADELPQSGLFCFFSSFVITAPLFCSEPVPLAVTMTPSGINSVGILCSAYS